MSGKNGNLGFNNAHVKWLSYLQSGPQALVPKEAKKPAVKRQHLMKWTQPHTYKV